MILFPAIVLTLPPAKLRAEFLSQFSCHGQHGHTSSLQLGRQVGIFHASHLEINIGTNIRDSQLDEAFLHIGRFLAILLWWPKSLQHLPTMWSTPPYLTEVAGPLGLSSTAHNLP